jgi:multidrug efflux system membrane fusion protein
MMSARMAVLATLACTALTGCKDEKNAYQPPPPPVVGVAKPLRQSVTRYFEATGNAAPVNSIDLIARVAGTMFQVGFTDGQTVKKGDELFVIEPAPFQARLVQAQAALASATATLGNNDAELSRQNQLGAVAAASRSTVDTARLKRDTSAADVDKARADLQIAAINLSYAHIAAPFDGVVSARLASIGDYVGVSGATKLASVVQLDPIYVTANVGEGDVLRIRAALAQGGKSDVDLARVPVEIGLANEQGYPHKGALNYIAPGLDPTTGTLQVRSLVPNPGDVILPGMFVRVRVPLRQQADAMLVPDAVLGNDLGGSYLLVVGEGDVVQQRRVRLGPLVGNLRVIDSGLQADDRVIVSGNQRAVPNMKVSPEAATIAAAP